MNSNIFGPNSSALSRDQRWEARRQAKFTQPIQTPAEKPDYSMPSKESIQDYPAYPNPVQENPSYTNQPHPKSQFPQSNPQDYPTYSKPPQDHSSYLNQPPPSHSKVLSQDFPSYVNQSYPQVPSLDLQPRSNQEKPPMLIQPNYPNSSISAELSPDSNVIKRKAYGLELQRQMEEQKREKQKVRTPNAEYFPFGKQGAGAPMRDTNGNIIARRPPKFNENDPNFLSPGNFYKNYKELSHSRSQQAINVQDKPGYSDIYNQQPSPPRMQKNSFQPPPSNNFQSQPINNFQPPPNFNPGFPNPYQNMGMNFQNQPFPGFPNPYTMQGMMPYPQMTAFQQYPNFAPTQNTFNPPQPDPPQYSQDPPRSFQQDLKQEDRPRRTSTDSPKPFFPEPSDDGQKSLDRVKKMEHGRVLLQQAEEKKRRQEEEKRQKILEERLEEERLARQRKEIEDQRRFEEQKERRKFQEVQDFNSKLIIEAKPKPKRQRTPYEPPAVNLNNNFNDLPPAMPMGPRDIFQPIGKNEGLPVSFAPAVPLVQEQKTLTETYPKLQTVTSMPTFPTEDNIQRFKQDLSENQNNLRQELIKLKAENLEAQGQRIEAQRELQRIREEFKQKELLDDIRQKEILSALNNTKPFSDPTTKLPPYKPLPYNLVEGRGDASLSLDPMKSLPSQSKLIPLPNPDINFPTFNPEPSLKKALQLDSLFPSLPENDPVNISYTSNVTANSSIGIEKLTRKNDDRLKYLENIEQNPHDELKKLDDILFNFAGKNNSFSRQSNRFKLEKIEEVDEKEYSLPRSRASDISLKWNKDWTDM